MKSTIITALIALFPLHASAKQPSKSNDSILVASPDTTRRIVMSYASWHLDEDWMVSAEYSCADDKLWNWWPLEPNCEGKLWLELNTNNSSGRLDFDKYNLKRTWGPYMAPGHTLSVDGKTGDATVLFNLVIKKETPILRVDDLIVELKDFKRLTNKVMKSRNKEANERVSELRQDVILRAIYSLALLLAFGFAARWIIRKTPTVAKGIAKGVISAAEEVDKMNARRVARDEVIRHTTREALSAATESEKEALRSQIKQAQASGNDELAASLSSVLKKLDRA